MDQLTTEQEVFHKLYSDALIKAAIGVHIIRTVGAECGLSSDIRDKNVLTLCTELATGVGLSVTTVYSDVMRTHKQFPSDFFHYPEVMKLTGELLGEMTRQNLLSAPVDVVH